MQTGLWSYLQTQRTHKTFTCLKSEMKTLEKGVKSVQNNQQRHQTTLLVSLYCKLWADFATFINVSIVEFEQLND